MKTIDNFMKKGGAVALLIVAIGLIIIAKIYDKPENETLVLYKDNPELQKINETLKNQVSKSESKILVLEAKIKTLEKTKKQQSWNLSNSTDNLETEIVEIVKIVQDSTLISLLNRVKVEQNNLAETYENIIELKDSVIVEKDNMIKSYIFATDKMSNEIEILHAKNNELLINENRNKSKIKKRNKIIVIGGSVVAAGIVGVILLSR